MTQEELIAAFDAIEYGDVQIQQSEAEGLLLCFLSDEGYGSVVDAYLAARNRVCFDGI